MDNYKLVSIAAYDRSGTTFLGGLLNEYKNTFYIGELDQGFKVIANQQETLCTCGSTVKECRIWEPVSSSFTEKAEGSNTKIIYDYLVKHTNSSIIVDSSKGMTQIRCAEVHNRENQALIHLIRNPKGVVYSRMKTTKRLMAKGIHARPELGKFTNLLLIMDTFSWCYQNIRLERYKKNRENVTVIYEELETAFDCKIIPFLRQKVGLITEYDETSVPHVLGGNINRYKGIGDIRIDNSWKEGLSTFQKYIVDFITFPVRKLYGYKF